MRYPSPAAKKEFSPVPGEGFATATLLLSEVQSENYAAFVFVGGVGSNIYFTNQDAIRIAIEMDKRKAVVASICLAPVILANAGLLTGKNATVAGIVAKTIELQGATYTGPGINADGNIVTGNAPKSSRLFG